MFPLTEQGNADRFVSRWAGVIHYSPDVGWIVWKDGRFQISEDLAEEMMSLTLREMDSEIEPGWVDKQIEAFLKWKASCQSDRRVQAGLNLARTRPEIFLFKSDVLDSYPWFFNCANGILDLKTCDHLPHDPKYKVTQISNAKIDENSTCERWLQFMNEITCGDEDLVKTLQMCIGCSMAGLSSRRLVIFLYGTGANGKSVFLDTIRHVFGEYSSHLMSDRLLERPSGNFANDLAFIRGKRFVTVSEFEPGHRLSTGMIKGLTGDETVTACQKFRAPFVYTPTYTFWIGTNHMPSLKRVDSGIRDRVVQVPFKMRLERDKQDKNLLKTLKTETDGILMWALEGCLLWQAKNQMITYSESVRVATHEYFAGEDHIGRFLEQCTTSAQNQTISANRLYGVYRSWCEREGIHHMKQITLSKAIGERGVESRLVHGYTQWYHIDIRSDIPKGTSLRDPDDSRGRWWDQ